MRWMLGLFLALFAGAALAARRQVAAGGEGASSSLLDVAAADVENAVSGFDDLYQKYGDAFGVDWRLVKAIAQHESGENPAAVNSSDNESLGLMQVLCRPDGAGGCSNKLNVDGWDTASRAGLLDADFNVYIGAQILAANIASYGVPKGIAVYNSWDQHTAPTAGPFKNQAYVDDVLRRAALLGYSQ